MAADADLLDIGKQVIPLAGPGRGADTDLVMEAPFARNLKKVRVNEIRCKPLNPRNIPEAWDYWAQDRTST